MNAEAVVALMKAERKAYDGMTPAAVRLRLINAADALAERASRYGTTAEDALTYAKAASECISAYVDLRG